MLRVRGRQALRLKIVTAAHQANDQNHRFVQTIAQNQLRLTSFRARIVSHETNTSRTSARSRSFKLAKGVRVRRCKIRVRRVQTLFLQVDGKTRASRPSVLFLVHDVKRALAPVRLFERI